jgi:hypothetical protein
VPTGLKRNPDDVLTWDDPLDADFQYFTVYGSDIDHLDGSETVIGHTVETSLDVAGQSCAYFLVTACDFAGNESEAASLDALADVPSAAPTRFTLQQCVPNPFNPSTVIAFDLPRASRVGLRVYDVSGRLVRVLVDGESLGSGRCEVTWHGRDDLGRTVPSGTYFCRLEVGDHVETKRMTLLK